MIMLHRSINLLILIFILITIHVSIFIMGTHFKFNFKFSSAYFISNKSEQYFTIQTIINIKNENENNRELDYSQMTLQSKLPHKISYMR